MRLKAVEERSALELIEEAFYLLRAAPASALIAYYLGSLPFILGLLFFWSDMARSAFAEQRLLPGSCSLALAFLWMKLWQAVFTRHLHARLCGEPQPRWQIRWLTRVAIAQAIVQPLGLFLLPVAFTIMLPFGWTLAFFNNVTLFSAEPAADLRAIWQRSWRQTFLWPMQNHNLIFILVLFALVIFFNLYSGVLGIPFLLDLLFGVESVFTQSPTAAMNSTMTAAMAGLTYLCCDPLCKAVYVLRCFYGESLRTGQDLQAELRALTLGARSAVLALALLLSAHAAHAADPAAAVAAPSRPAPPAAASGALAPPALDRSIDQVMQQREYSWRWPRETAPATDRSTWAARVNELLTRTFRALGRLIGDILSAIRNLWSRSGVPSPSGSVLAHTALTLLIVIILGLVGLLVWVAFRWWRSHQLAIDIPAEPLPPAPDLTDENVGADQLPGDEWIRLARELLGRGELRLALRAWYLATLAHLAHQNLILIARFKSNRDYERELARRGHALAAVLALFSQNLTVFERVWYGRHDVSPEMLQEFSGNVERMKIA